MIIEHKCVWNARRTNDFIVLHLRSMHKWLTAKDFIRQHNSELNEFETNIIWNLLPFSRQTNWETIDAGSDRTRRAYVMPANSCYSCKSTMILTVLRFFTFQRFWSVLNFYSIGVFLSLSFFLCLTIACAMLYLAFAGTRLESIREKSLKLYEIALQMSFHMIAAHVFDIFVRQMVKPTCALRNNRKNQKRKLLPVNVHSNE